MNETTHPTNASIHTPHEEITVFPIVVGIDPDTAGAHALRQAAAVAHHIGRAQLHLCRAITPGVGINRDEAMLERELHNLRSFAQTHLGNSWLMWGAQLHAAFGKPADVLAQLAVDTGAALIVIGCHKRRGLDRVIQSSVSKELLREAPCPTLIALPYDRTGLEASPAFVPSQTPGGPTRTLREDSTIRLSIPLAAAAQPAAAQPPATLPGAPARVPQAKASTEAPRRELEPEARARTSKPPKTDTASP